jgi:methyl-accepting chemotaxis protein
VIEQVKEVKNKFDRSLKVTGKLIITHMLIVFVMGSLLIYGLFSFHTVNESNQRMFDELIVPLERLSTIATWTENTRVRMITSISNRNNSGVVLIENTMKLVDEEIAIYESYRMNSEELTLFDELKTNWQAYKENVAAILVLLKAGEYEIADEESSSAIKNYGRLTSNLQDIVSLKEGNVRIMQEENQQMYKTTTTILSLLGLLALLVSLGIAILIGRRIGIPLARISDQLKAIAKGDLSREQLQINHKDEIGELSRSANQMQNDIKMIVTSIANAAKTVTKESKELMHASNEVREGNEQIAITMNELATGSNEQANHTSEISEMMDNFVQTIQEANEGGEEISSISSKVLEKTQEGSKLMGNSVEQMSVIDHIVKEAVVKMEKLDKQTSEISKLVNVIKEMADQTNLLSLNATIESARAGEHGKGFAVVATEVRSLSEKVSQSVEDITKIVSSIQLESNEVSVSLKKGYQEVDKGSKQIQTTGKTFQEIDEVVSRMSKRIKGISNNLENIASDSQQMNASIQEIASVSEEASAGIQQVSASSLQASNVIKEVSLSADGLSRVSERLNNEIQKFKI